MVHYLVKCVGGGGGGGGGLTCLNHPSSHVSWILSSSRVTHVGLFYRISSSRVTEAGQVNSVSSSRVTHAGQVNRVGGRLKIDHTSIDIRQIKYRCLWHEDRSPGQIPAMPPDAGRMEKIAPTARGSPSYKL